ncbi:MAG: hydrogenase maturation protease [Bacillota bacterium]|jgi:hydrogenase maturation protease|nr:hydrogenase maturation protease [Bacillota bacterium]
MIFETVVLGIGNTLMEDDGVGNYIVEELKTRGVFPGLRLEKGETDTEFCLDVLEETEKIILIDAVHMGNPPGTVSIFELDNEFFQSLPSAGMAHNFSLFHGMKLYGCQREGLLIGIEAASVNCRFGLSEELTEKMPRIVDTVTRQIESYLTDIGELVVPIDRVFE